MSNPSSSMNCRLTALLLCAGLALWAVPMRATSVVAPSFEQLVGQSDFIVRATVKSVTAEWRQSPGQRQIVTKVELEVGEVITGAPPTPLVLTLLGGKIGEVEMRVDGVPRFTVGEEHIFFVQGNGRQFCPLVGVMHGNYPITRDPATGLKYVARGNGAPLYAQGEVAQPMTSAALVRAQHAKDQPLSPEAFTSSIRQVHEVLRQQTQRAQ